MSKQFTNETGKTILPTISSQTEAQEEINQLNVINQSIIELGAKEGVIEAITKLVSSNITNAILQTADRSNHKSINNFTLFNMLQVAIDGADHPSTNDVLEQLIKLISHTLDFCKIVSINMELIQSNVAQMATYGIIVGIPQLMLTLLANIETAAKSNYGLEFHVAMHTICKKYTYKHMHDATSLRVILMELVGENGVRVLKDAPTPSTGAVHSIADSVSYLHAMMDGDFNSAYTKLVYGVGTDSNLSEEEGKPCECNCKKSQHSKLHGECEKKKKYKDIEPKKNSCPHRKKFHRMKSHRVNPDKCMWYKK